MKKVLILVDLQNDFVSPEGSLSNPACCKVVDNVLKVLDTTRNIEYLFIKWAQDVCLPDNL